MNQLASLGGCIDKIKLEEKHVGASLEIFLDTGSIPVISILR